MPIGLLLLGVGIGLILYLDLDRGSHKRDKMNDIDHPTNSPAFGFLAPSRLFSIDISNRCLSLQRRMRGIVLVPHFPF